MEKKSDQYVRQSQVASSDIASWPKWMQRNLEPTRVTVKGTYHPAKSASGIALSKSGSASQAKSTGDHVVKAPPKKKQK
jgi:hypothetical protein